MAADATVLNLGVGGETLPSYYVVATGTNWPAGVTGYLTSKVANNNVIQDVDLTHGLPVQQQTGASFAVTLTSTTITGSVAVTGTFWQATQPISAASLPLPTGAATSANQATEITSLASIDGKITACNTGAVVITSGTVTFSNSTIAVTNSGTFATQATQAGTWNITNISGTVSLPTGASTSALQTTGNSSLSSIDGKTPSLGQALAAASVPVVLTAAQLTTLTPLTSVAVTNIGTFAVQATLSAGSAVIGHVIVDSGSITANAGTNLNTSLLALEGGGNLATLAGGVSAAVYQDNIKQINGVAPLMGNGVTGTGSQRVTISSDNTAFSVNATLSAETTKVIGTVNQGTSPWVCSLTSTTITGTVAVTQSGSWTNTVTQATGSNLHTVLDSGTLTTCSTVTTVSTVSTLTQWNAGHGTAAAALRVELPTDGTGVVGLNAGSNLIGKVGIDQTTPGTTNAVQDIPNTSGGLSFNYQIAPSTPAKTAVKASAGQLYAIKAMNIGATPVYIKLFNVASAGVTLGTTACDDQYLVPGNTAGAGFVTNVDKGIAYSTAITAAITGGIASADNTSITASNVIVTFYFK